jgi:hypothetical protein
MKKYHWFNVTKYDNSRERCLDEGFIGVGFFRNIELTSILSRHDENGFVKEMKPLYLEKYPEYDEMNGLIHPKYFEKDLNKSKAIHKLHIESRRGCSATWALSKGINVGDIIISPVDSKNWMAGEVTSAYYYHPGASLSHRRKVSWLPKLIALSSMSYELGKVSHIFVRYSNITKFSEELEALISGKKLSRKKEVNPGFAKTTKATVTAKEHNTKVLIEALEEYRLTKGISKEILKKEKLKTILPDYSGATTPFYEGLLPSFEKVYNSKKKRFNKPTATTLRNNLTKTDYFT